MVVGAEREKARMFADESAVGLDLASDGEDLFQPIIVFEHGIVRDRGSGLSVIEEIEALCEFRISLPIDLKERQTSICDQGKIGVDEV